MRGGRTHCHCTQHNVRSAICIPPSSLCKIPTPLCRPPLRPLVTLSQSQIHPLIFCLLLVLVRFPNDTRGMETNMSCSIGPSSCTGFPSTVSSSSLLLLLLSCSSNVVGESKPVLRCGSVVGIVIVYVVIHLLHHVHPESRVRTYRRGTSIGKTAPRPICNTTLHQLELDGSSASRRRRGKR